MDVYLRIAKLYLEEADHVSAEAYINRAGMLQSDVDRSDLHVIYKVSNKTVSLLMEKVSQVIEDCIVCLCPSRCVLREWLTFVASSPMQQDVIYICPMTLQYIRTRNNSF